MKLRPWIAALVVPAAALSLGALPACGKKEPKKPGMEEEGDEGGGGGGGGSKAIPANAGSIEGVVKFTGTKPEGSPKDVSGSEGCVHDHAPSGEAPFEEVVVNPNGTLKYAIAYIESSEVADYKFDVPKEPAEVDQLGCVYIPHVKTVMTGQAVVYKNSDKALHNVHTYATLNKAMNTASPAGALTKPVKYRKEEIFQVKCDVHPWMSSFMAVFPHPYHAVSDATGAFKISNVPPGTYKLHIWHEKLGKQEVSVTVPESGTAKAEVTYK